MKKILNRLTQYETLTEKESRNIIIEISEGKLNTSEISSFLTIYMIRNILFEPFESTIDFNLNYIQKQVNRIFSFNNPLIISTHRANYIGRIDQKNRLKNLNYLKEFLDFLVDNYAVEFMSSDELLTLIMNDK